MHACARERRSEKRIKIQKRRVQVYLARAPSRKTRRNTAILSHAEAKKDLVFVG